MKAYIGLMRACAPLAVLAASICLTTGSAHANTVKVTGGNQVAASTNSYATVSGVVSKLDVQAGTLVLDGKRSYEFVASTLVVHRQNALRRAAGIADVKVGARVSLTVVKDGATAVSKISEIWIGL